MEITDALIRKFFDDACTPEEADWVSRYFAENPAELKRYLGPDWKAAVREETDFSRRIYIGWAAAAVMILLAGLGLLRLRQKEAGPYTATLKDTVSEQLAWKWRVRTNPSAERENIVLPDGTAVTLFAQGKIGYRDPFPADKREIVLEGQASFAVVRDVIRPFTVKAGGTTTTVLGTCFNVLENEQGVTVKLYKGRVSVRAATKEFLLVPGEQVKVAAGKDSGEVSLFKKEIAAATAHDKPVIHDNQEVLVFDHTSLPEVMARLMSRYRVVIEYNKEALSTMYFTGSVLRSDSLSTILLGIGNINDLTIVKKENGFVVSGSPH